MSAPLNLLIVEDSEDDADLLAAETARGGLNARWTRVETLADVRRALAASAWDAVISDYHIRGVTAAQVLAAVRDGGQDLPFIIVSGVVQAEQVVALLKSGAHDFIAKDALARLAPAIEREVRETAQRAQRRAAEERVRILSAVVEQSPVSVVVADCDGAIGYVNPRFEQTAGYSAAQAVGRRLDFTCVASDQTATNDEMWAALRRGEAWRGEFRNRRSDGAVYWEYVTVSPLTGEDGRIAHFVAVKEDITVRRAYEERLLRQAHYDALTDLPNRLLMRDRLDQAMATARRNNAMAALLHVGLDRFKSVNDAFGHAAGDKLLKEAAGRLIGCVQEADTVARLGGDEFAVILPDVANPRAAQHVAERVVKAFKTPFVVEGRDHVVTASVGVTLYPIDGDDRQTLAHNADLAMSDAKEQKRDGWRFFTAQLDRQSQERLALESQLRGARARNELTLHYQPIIDLRTGRPSRYEALMRWRPANGAFCPPDKFIPVAEELGLIIDLGEWALRTALRDLPTLTGDDAAARVAVNVSPHQLRGGHFAPLALRLLQEAGVSPQRLELEITESALLEDQADIADSLRLLSGNGVRLSIDDFGAGYSSLRYLQRFPFNTLKIDRSFISAAPQAPASRRLVETIIVMAQGMGLDVVAEGVETQEQLAFLRDGGCDMAQGYYYSRPRPLEDFAADRYKTGR